MLDYRFAKQHQVLVDTSSADNIKLYYSNETALSAIEEVRRVVGHPLNLCRLDKENLMSKLSAHYQRNSHQSEHVLAELKDTHDLKQLAKELPPVDDLLASEQQAPVIKLINALLSQAVLLRASDIHIEAFAEQLLVRIRIDGLLQTLLTLEPGLQPLISSRIKVMAKLDIAEKRLPQDGRMQVALGNQLLDLRVSTLPAHYGERIVIRVLDKKSQHFDLEQIGLDPNQLAQIKRLVEKNHGIVLVTGPTGSGKTTSLYSMLKQCDRDQHNILTIEDPIEYDLPGIGQTQVNPKAQLTFAKGLRALLRQDPDIVMIGEIRDHETAQIAVQASLTGHLVLSTLHTNSAVGAITRLRDMGIAPFLLSSSLVAVIAQRLLRLLCEACKTPIELSAQVKKSYQLPEHGQYFQAKGCNACGQSGYFGRTGIYDLLEINEAAAKLIEQMETEHALSDALARSKQPLFHAGLNLVVKGQTSLDELIRIC